MRSRCRYECLAADRPPLPDPAPSRSKRLPSSTEIRPLLARDRDAVIALLERVARLGRRPATSRPLRLEARRKPVRTVDWMGGGGSGRNRRRPAVHALGVRARSPLGVPPYERSTRLPILRQQGRGLFTALTLHAVDACAGEGIDLVFNTPNEPSRRGYLRLGWRDVGRLATAVRPRWPLGVVRLARSRGPAELWSDPVELGRPVSEWLETGRWDAYERSRQRPSSTDRRLRTHVDRRFMHWRYSFRTCATASSIPEMPPSWCECVDAVGR